MQAQTDTPPKVNPHRLPPPHDPTTAWAYERLASTPGSPNWTR
jgi:hypothetical protein